MNEYDEAIWEVIGWAMPEFTPSVGRLIREAKDHLKGSVFELLHTKN